MNKMKNKNIFQILILAIFLFVGFGIVSADEDQVTSGSQTNKQQMQKNVPAAVMVQEEVERKKTLKESYQEKLQSLFQKREEVQNREEEEEGEVGQQNEKREEVQNRIEEKKESQKEKQEEVQNRVEERKAEMEKKKVEIKGRLEEQIRERVKTSVEKILAHFESLLNKISEIKDKTQERIVALELRGIDLTESKTLMEIVPVKIEEAKTEIANLKIALQEALDSEEPQTAFETTKELTLSAKNAVKEAHKSLVDVISSIKASVRATTATTTPTTTDDNDNEN